MGGGEVSERKAQGARCKAARVEGGKGGGGGGGVTKLRRGPQRLRGGDDGLHTSSTRRRVCWAARRKGALGGAGQEEMPTTLEARAPSVTRDKQARTGRVALSFSQPTTRTHPPGHTPPPPLERLPVLGPPASCTPRRPASQRMGQADPLPPSARYKAPSFEPLRLCLVPSALRPASFTITHTDPPSATQASQAQQPATATTRFPPASRLDIYLPPGPACLFCRPSAASQPATHNV